MRRFTRGRWKYGHIGAQPQGEELFMHRYEFAQYGVGRNGKCGWLCPTCGYASPRRPVGEQEHAQTCADQNPLARKQVPA